MPNLNNLTMQDLQWGTENWSGQGYIDGLQMQWVSATAVTVTSGAAYIPSLKKCMPVPNDIALAGLVLTASTFYHIYLYSNAGTPAVECVTTAPASPYSGKARAKTGDTSRRYLGSVLTDASGNIFNFISLTNELIIYRVKTSVAPFRILSGGTATVTTSISAAGVSPATSRSVYMIPTNQDGSLGVSLTSSDSSEPTMEIFVQSSGGTGMSRPPTIMHLDASNSFQYSYPSTPSGSFYVDVWGYFYGR